MSGIANHVINLLLFLFVILAIWFLYANANQYQSNAVVAFVKSLLLNAANRTAQVLITTTVQPANVSRTNAELEAYALSLINKDRGQYGLQNITLSGEPSAQQHSQSMLSQNYFSHWDTYGMKPYMRYTLLGGIGAMDENVAYKYSGACLLSYCSGNIDAKAALQAMEYSMMYNDSACCNNGHRNNILDPEHNQVSIGIAYNSSSVYFTEDFMDNYINWTNYGMDATNNEMYLSGTLHSGFSLSSIIISYDPLVENMSRIQLDNTSSYSYGLQVAGVASNPLIYYPGMQTVYAGEYKVGGNKLSIAFSMQGVISKNGPGEYTVMVWLNDTRGRGFVGSTYTIFIGSDGKAYAPRNV